MQLFRITYVDDTHFVTNEWFASASDMHARIEQLSAKVLDSLHVEDLTLPDLPNAMADWLNRTPNTPVEI